MSAPAALCPSCGQPTSGRFCANCGEKRIEAADHTLRRLLEHLFGAFTHADGKVFLSMRHLLLSPGRLTADYLRGRRKPYIPPLELFLITNLIFFLLHPLIGSNTLTTDLNTHLHYTWHNRIAQSLVTPRLAARNLTVDAYGVIFDSAAVTQAKSLVILVVPIFSLAVLALYWRHRRHYSVHLVFSLHFAAFWLLLICASLTLTNLVVRVLRSAALFPSAVGVSWSIIGFCLAIMAVYLFRAVRAVFARENTWVTVAKALMLGIAFDLSLQAYRFVLFFITFWTT